MNKKLFFYPFGMGKRGTHRIQHCRDPLPSCQRSIKEKLSDKFRSLKPDLISGLLVSFIAMPLCIAIASASEFPVLSGIFTAIIGGILVSRIGGSNVAINGPAAGMIVVIFDAVEKLGGGNLILGYKCTLAAIVCASIAQILTSFTRLPNLMRNFPEHIVRAMMMAIGLIVILKQIFVLFGFKAPHANLLEFFLYIPKAFLGMQIESFAIGAAVIALILVWKKFLEKWQIFRVIPVYLIAIILGSIAANFFTIHEDRRFLVESSANPVVSSFIALPNNILEAISFPDFSLIASANFWIATFTIYAVASLETLLSAVAVDKIDPLARKTNLKKDLRAIGLGNLLCGSVGALPMIAETVRSTANIAYGAKSRWSNFFHGALLLLMVSIGNSYMKFIPFCVLAGMLILIGFNMINPRLFLKIARESKCKALIILVVILLTLYIDLLAGISSGLALHLILEKMKILKKR